MKRSTPAILIIACLVLLLGLGYLLRYPISTALSTLAPRFTPEQKESFPNIPTKNLSPTQQKILRLARAEYAKHPISYDADVLTYSEGNKEPWCADFASWIMLQASAPYANPHSGHWRIPGVLTLREYYQSRGRYTEAADYTPKTGDIAFFIGKNSRDIFNRQHVALVLEARDGHVTTLGGNEGGHLRLSTQLLRLGEDSLAGFGKLE